MKTIKKTPNEPNTVVYMGEVAVDSGQLVIIDPCYLQDWKNGEYHLDGKNKDKNNYHEACEASLSKKGFGQIFKGLAIASSTLYGDGSYPVFAVTNAEGNISRIVIDFDDLGGTNNEKTSYFIRIRRSNWT